MEIVVSGVWALVSGWLLMWAAVSLVSAMIYGFGTITDYAQCRQGTLISCGTSLFYFFVVGGGWYLLDMLIADSHMLRTSAVSKAVFAVCLFFFLVSRFPAFLSQLAETWVKATVPGALDEFVREHRKQNDQM